MEYLTIAQLNDLKIKAAIRDMPFKSKAQARYMFAKHPKIAKRWAEKTPSIKRLPNKKRPKKK